MVIALLALGLVMILGGIAAVVQGFPYVRLESGLAMVIAGATAASAGAVTLGLSAIVLRLKRIEAAFLVARFNARDHGFDESAPNTDFVGASATAAAIHGDTASYDLFADVPAEPSLPKREPADPIRAQTEPAEPWLPEPRAEPTNLAAARFAGPLEPSAGQGIEAASTEGNASDAPGTEAEMTLRPSFDTDAAPTKVDIPEAAPLAGPELESAAEPPPAIVEHTPSEDAKSDQHQPGSELEVIGTYSSGGNTYVMFADGTIEAETPRGRFNFNSLEELKDFVDSGGEHETRGAA